MFLHCWPVCTSAFRKASLGIVLWAAVILVLGLGAARAAPADHRKHAERNGEVDTEHLFGFTEGSDIGHKGEKELESDSTGRFGRLGGSYNNVAAAFEAKYTFAERFRLSAVATASSRVGALPTVSAGRRPTSRAPTFAFSPIAS
jgi:hypothetical protein